jgi:phenylacetate-CoA ligase
MFTVFNPELAAVAAAIRDEHVSFLAGEWTAARLASHQLDRFQATLRYTARQSAFYRGRLAAVEPADVRSLHPDQLAGIPFTTKADLRQAQQDILSKPLSGAWILYETTGTTGASTPCPRDNIDSLSNNTVLTTYYDTIFRQFTGDQFIGVSGPTELHAFGDTFGDVCRNLGLAVVKMWPHSPMVGFDRALEVLRTVPVTGLFCTPGMALSLAKKAVAAGLEPRRDFRLDVLMLTGELASPALLENIGELWDARAYNALYASQEASVLGAAGADGRLYTAPLINFYEVIDPVTAAPVSEVDGCRTGELVVTGLYQGAKPLVRYRTGDLVRLRRPHAGQTLPAPSVQPLGRTNDELVVNGRRISGYDLEDLLLGSVRGYLDYQIGISAAGAADRLVLELEVDPAAPPRLDDRPARACREVLDADLDVRFARLGSITGTGAMVSWKAARVVDHRGAGPDPEKTAAAELAAARS